MGVVMPTPRHSEGSGLEVDLRVVTFGMPVNPDLAQSSLRSVTTKDGTDSLALVLERSLASVRGWVGGTGHDEERDRHSEHLRHAPEQVQQVRLVGLDRPSASFGDGSASGQVDDLSVWVAFVSHDWTPLALVDMASLILGPRSIR